MGTWRTPAIFNVYEENMKVPFVFSNPNLLEDAYWYAPEDNFRAIRFDPKN